MRARGSEALEFTVSPTIENRPVVLEPDRTGPRQQRRWIALGLLLVSALAFEGWQKHEPRRQGYLINDLRRQRAEAEDVGRLLRLELWSLQAPATLEYWASHRLHMQPADEQIVLERVLPSDSLPSSVLAKR